MINRSCHHYNRPGKPVFSRLVYFFAPSEGSLAPEVEPHSSYTEYLDSLGVNKEKRKKLQSEIQNRLSAMNINTEITDEKMDELLKMAFGETPKLPKKLEEAIVNFSNSEMTDQDFNILSTIALMSVDNKQGVIEKVTHFLQKDLRHTIGDSISEDESSDDSGTNEEDDMETPEDDGGVTSSSGTPVKTGTIDSKSSNIPNDKPSVSIKEDGNEDENDLEVSVNSAEAAGILRDVESQLRTLHEQFGAGDFEASEDNVQILLAAVEAEEKKPHLLGIAPVIPLGILIDIRNIARHLKEINQYKKENKPGKRRRKERQLAGLTSRTIRKLARLVKTVVKAQARVPHRQARFDNRQESYDNRTTRNSQQRVGRGIGFARHKAAQTADYPEVLEARRERTSETKRHLGNSDDLRYAGTEGAKATRREGRIARRKLRRANRGKEQSVGNSLDEMTMQQRKAERGKRVKDRGKFRRDKDTLQSGHNIEDDVDEHLNKTDRQRKRTFKARQRQKARLDRIDARRGGKSKADTLAESRAILSPTGSIKIPEDEGLVAGKGSVDLMNDYFPAANPDSIRELEKYVQTEGLMSPEEVERMNITQNDLFEHYINPAFILFIEGREEKINPIILAAIDEPDMFRYTELKPGVDGELGVVEIQPSLRNEDTPRNFLIRIENGNIVRVRSGETDESLELKDPSAPLPWTKEGKFNTKINGYFKRFTEEYHEKAMQKATIEWQNLSPAEQTTPQWNEIFSRQFLENVDPLVTDMYRINSTVFITRLKELVDSRGLDGEGSHPYYTAISDLASRADSYPYALMTSEKRSDLYLIKERQGNNYVEVAAVSLDGYFMDKNSDGSYEKSPIYAGGSLDVSGDTLATTKTEKLAEAADALDNASMEQIIEIMKEMSPDELTEETIAGIRDNRDYYVDWMKANLRGTADAYTDETAQNIKAILAKTVNLAEGIPDEYKQLGEQIATAELEALIEISAILNPEHADSFRAIQETADQPDYYKNTLKQNLLTFFKDSSDTITLGQIEDMEAYFEK